MNDDGRLNKTPDSRKYCKDCPDFVCLKDGTLLGDYKYCNLSTICTQAGYLNGKPMPMENHYCPVMRRSTGELSHYDYYCTGKYDKREREERLEGDEKVS